MLQTFSVYRILSEWDIGHEYYVFNTFSLAKRKAKELFEAQDFEETFEEVFEEGYISIDDLSYVKEE